MRGIQDRHSLRIQFLDIVQNVASTLRINTHGWFVHNDDCRLVHERSSDVDPALHASREFVHSIFLTFHKSNDLQDFTDPFVRSLPRRPVHPAPEAEIFMGG